MAVAVGAAVVVVAEAGIVIGDAAPPGDGVDNGIAEVQIAHARHVVVLNVVQVDAARAVVADADDGGPANLLIDRHGAELSLCRADVLVDVAQAGGRQRDRAGAGQGTGVAVGHVVGGVRIGAEHDYGVVGRILDGVEGDIAKVTLVGDAVAAAQRSFTVAEDVDREADAGRNGAVLRIPKTANGAFGRGGDAAVAHLLRDVAARTVVEVRVKILVVVVLHAEILITRAVGKGEARRDLELVLPVDGPVMKAIGAGKGGLTDRQGDGAGLGLRECAGIRIAGAGRGTVGVHGCLELVKIAGKQILQTRGLVHAQLFIGLGIGSVAMVVLNVEHLATELELVIAAEMVQVLVPLDGVLRSAEGQAAVARIGVIKAGQLEWLLAERVARASRHKERGCVLQGGVVGV